ncbi:MAG: zinc-ribbon domain-containing protein [Caldilineaceae bacterium]
MYCLNCGTQVPEGANFCLKCGSKLKDIPIPSQGYWETCTIELSSKSGLWKTTWQYWAKVIAPKGIYSAAVSETWKTWGSIFSDPRLLSEYSWKSDKILDDFVAHLISTGWQLTNHTGRHHYSFRRWMTT